MPIYEYTCPGCGQEFEELVRGDEEPPCPSCGQRRVERQMSVTAAHVVSSSQPSCPARDICGASGGCCGSKCGMAQ